MTAPLLDVQHLSVGFGTGPQAVDAVKDVSFQMRMVFKNVTTDSLLWEWQRSTDEWKTSTVMMSIDYKRRR